MKRYENVGDVAEADCLIGHSFGTSVDHQSPNEQLAFHMLYLSEGRPMIADRTLVTAMPDGDTSMAHIVEGKVTDLKAQGVGTWGTLLEAKQFMDEEGLEAPIMIAQAYHISRVARQAARLGIDSIIPKNLPVDFDRNSEQIWTRSPHLWIPFNAVGSLLLKRRGQL